MLWQALTLPEKKIVILDAQGNLLDGVPLHQLKLAADTGRLKPGHARLRSSCYDLSSWRSLRSGSTRRIHLQEPHRRAAAGRLTDNPEAVHAEMLRPWISLWMEQRRNLAGVGIDAGEVRSLERVTTIAGQAEIFQRIVHTMLRSEDVLDVEGNKRRRRLRHTAILALFARALPDKPAGCGVHARLRRL